MATVAARAPAASEAGTHSGELEPRTQPLPGRCVRIKRNGLPCELYPVHGATVCHKHGGAAKAIRRNGNARLAAQSALQHARAELERQGTPDLDPLEHLEAALAESARTYALWRLACDALLDQGTTSSAGTKGSTGTLASELLGKDRHGQLAIHPYVEERDKALAQWTRASKMALDAGVAQKRVAIAQREGELFATAWTAVIERARAQGLAEGLAAQLGPWLAQELQRAQAKQLPRST